ncbi:MAG: helix-turn-helix domain-containing protein [Terrisporobacter sp.]
MEDRLIIEYGLDQNYTLKEIADKLKKAPTTISKEIKRNKFLRVSKAKANDIQPCKNRRSCTKINLCNSACGKLCKKCTFINCYRACTEFSIKKCVKLTRTLTFVTGVTLSLRVRLKRTTIKLRLQIQSIKNY